MKIIRNDKELIGKTIAFAHIAQFAENITIATEDGCVVVVQQMVDDNTEDVVTHIMGEHKVLKYIEENDYLRTNLGNLGIFDVEAYRKKRQEERLKYIQEIEAKKLKEERELYEKLKAKFEGVNQ